MATLKRRLIYGCVVCCSIILILLVYFAGPASKLTLLSRLHYNLFYILTPCRGESHVYDDEGIRFSYRSPSKPLSSVRYVTGDFRGERMPHIPLENIEQIAVMDWGGIYRYSLDNKTFPVNEIKIGGLESVYKMLQDYLPEKDKSIEKIAFKRGYGFKVLDWTSRKIFTADKQGRVYMISLPSNSYQDVNPWFLQQLLYEAGWIQSELGRYSTRGLGNWLIVPCAEKQDACSINGIIKTLEIKG